MTKPIEVIVAATDRGEIGYKNTLPWRLKGDLPRFKAMTKGHVVIMGSKTYYSLPKPLVDRVVIVLSRKVAGIYHPTLPIYVCPGLDHAIAFAKGLSGDRRIFVAGGASVYAEALAMPDTILHWTKVNHAHHADRQEKPLEYDTTIPDFQRILTRYDTIQAPEVVSFPDDPIDQTYSHAYITMQHKRPITPV